MGKAVELAKKLKALADKGEKGERTNAALILERHLEKHGITLDDIEEEGEKAHFFKCQYKQKTILFQTILMVLGKNAKIWRSKRSKTEFIVECTFAQYVNIEAAFEFYWKAYEAELKAFTKAFIYKNEMLPSDAETASGKLSEEEVAKLLKMMNSIQKQTFHKQLKADRQS